MSNRPTTTSSSRPILVLSSRRAFEAFTGPVPASLTEQFLFLKPQNEVGVASRLADCRLVISKNYPRPELNRWIFAARRLGVPTLLLVDGPLEWSNIHANPSLSQTLGAARGLFQPVLHDAVAGIGEAQNRWIQAQNEARDIVYLAYANRRIRPASPPATAGADARRAPAPEAPPFDFLVTTARTPYFDSDEKAALCETLALCGRALEQQGSRVVSRLFDPDLQQAFAEAAPSAIHETQGTFRDALERTCCVIGTPSSVLLEAMLHEKPTATLLFRPHPLLWETGWQLGAESDWPRTLAEMGARERTRMQTQRRLLADNLSEQDFFEHVEEILQNKLLKTPRPLDDLDREFEHRALRGALGWRARWIAPFVRALRGRRPAGRT